MASKSKSNLDERYHKTLERYQKYKQSHALGYYNELELEEQKKALLDTLDYHIPVESLQTWFHNAQPQNYHDDDESHKKNIKPFSGKVCKSSEIKVSTDAWDVGLKAIEKGEVAAVTLAGGQGTRLGFDGPKGMYVLPNMQGKKSLFQLLAERLLRLKQLVVQRRNSNSNSNSDRHSYGESCRLPWYIMTSPINDRATREFFCLNEYFGLHKDDVVFFEQSMLPCLDNEGKIILETKDKVSMAPNGNGGIWTQIKDDGIALQMKENGIKYVHVFSIDNALTRPADPLFIGYCINEKADCGNKVLWKSHALEKVGVIAEINSKPLVIEYSDMDKSLCEEMDESGKLAFGAGNICNHFFTTDFILDSIIPTLDDIYHVARKKIPYFDENTGNTISPERNNGIKLESFIFDVFPFSKRMAILEVLRDEEFAPVKNAPGEETDSPESARLMISALAKKYVVAAGYTLVGDTNSDVCEISPMTTYSGEELTDIVTNEGNDKHLNCPFYL